jgi:hypothetical protein
MSAGVLKSVVLGAASLVIVAALFVQQRQVRAARAQNEQLRAQLAAAEQQAEDASGRLARAQTNVPTGPDPELLRLRGEVARLRAVEAELATARQRMNQPKPAAPPPAAVQPPAPAEEAMAQYNQRVGAMTTSMKQIALALRLLCNDQATTDKSILPNGQLNPKLTQLLSTGENAAAIDWSNVELLISDAGALNQVDPNTLIARSKPIQSPDGRWMRVYAMADGSAHRRAHQTPEEIWDGSPAQP